MAESAAAMTGERLDRVREVEVSLDADCLGKCAEAFGDPVLAIAYFRRALEAAPSAREANRRRATLGAALYRSGARDEALGVLLESVELDPSFDTNRESYTALLELHCRRGELRKALGLARAMVPTLSGDPRFARAYDDLLASIDRSGEPAATPRPVQRPDPFAAARTRVQAGRRQADVLERHLLALAG